MPEANYEIQVKVPVCVTLLISHSDAESMYHDELCEVVDCVLNDAEQASMKFHVATTVAGREINVMAKVAPHWDHVPIDECELTLTHEGLFPEQ